MKLGYERQPLAETPGEVSLRGDIMDIFPFAATEPIRIEVFDDTIESLRAFDPADQRSTMSHEDLHLCLAADSAEVGDASATHATELFGSNSLMVTIEPLRNAERAEALRVRYAAALAEAETALARSEAALHSPDTWRLRAQGTARREAPSESLVFEDSFFSFLLSFF